MALIETRDSDIRPDQLTLDFYLEATPINNPFNKVDMTGKATYVIKPYLDNLGFGITSIDLDIKPNLQPVVNITFKDLYGNLLFNTGENDFNYDVLFQLPYPKFTLYIKGYVGKPVSFLLQVKSVKTSYVPSDGSYEIKAEFVPNVFGFFADIPYQYLFAVSELKKDGSKSIIDIAKNGDTIKREIVQTNDKYKNILDRLTQLKGSPASISEFYNNKSLAFGPIEGDNDLINAGFKNIKFNIDNINPQTKQPYGSIRTDALNVFGRAIVASINSDTRYSFSKIPSSINEQEYKKGIAIIDSNLEIINNETARQGYVNVKEDVIDSQTIYNVMTRLAGDCAYILGYILEGGINGFNSDPSRKTNNDIYGLYYPLADNANLKSGSLSAQVPYPQATKEIKKVEAFVEALYTGKQKAEEIIEKITNPEPPAGTEDFTFSNTQTFGKLVKKITNIENSSDNPYTDNVDQFINCLIQRAGIISSGYAGKVFNSNGAPLKWVIDAEFENIKPVIETLRSTKKETLKNFCTEFESFCKSDGTLQQGKNFDTKTSSSPSLSYKDYFAGYLNKLPGASTLTNQFSGGTVNSLATTYVYNNNITYWNPKDLVNAFKAQNAKANNLLTKGGNPEILVYASKDVLPDSIDSLIVEDNSSLDQLIPTPSGNPPEFYRWYSGKTMNKTSETVFLRFKELFADQGKLSIDQLIYNFSSLDWQGKTQPGVIFKALDDTVVRNPSDTIINFYDPKFRSILFFLCNNIRSIVKKTDKELDDAKKVDALAQRAKGQASEELPPEPVIYENNDRPQVYVRNEEEINAVYVQFHHIAQAWISLASTDDSGSQPTGTDVQISKKLETIYKSNDKNNNFYLNFDFPLVSQNDPGVDVSQALINTEPLLENNNQTSTLNMMQNICTLNNFLLQPIPGGVTNNLEELFLPQPESGAPVGRNALSVIWAPTPENRYSNNNNEPIYPQKDFFKILADNVQKPIAALRYGDVNNIIVKSIKAGTDDNKVTSESIQATNDIVNNQNNAKQKSFDCSMLAVMQGRSYKIGIDLIGNAQIFPTMYLGVEGLPIFTGLYWVTEVQHKLTPNNMETSVEAVKMKFNGKNFVSIYPITKRNVVGYVTNGSFQGGTDIFAGSELNYGFLQKVKDIKIKTTDDVNIIVSGYTSGKYTNFVGWFNKEIVGVKQFATKQINETDFKTFWDQSVSLAFPNYNTSSGNTGINFLEYLCVHALAYSYNEAGKYEIQDISGRIGSSTTKYQYIPDLTKPREELIKNIKNFADQWYTYYVGQQSNATNTQASQRDIVFISGMLNTRLNTYPTRAQDLADQEKRVKDASKSNKIITLAYDAPDADVIKAVNDNPTAIVVMFSAGAKKAEIVANTIKNKNDVYVIEMFGVKKDGKCTHTQVEAAVASGVPAKNIFAGNECNVGKGVIAGSSTTAGSSDHFQALSDAVSIIAGNSQNSGQNNKDEFIQAHYIRVATITNVLDPSSSGGQSISDTNGVSIYDYGTVVPGVAGQNKTGDYSGPQKRVTGNVCVEYDKNDRKKCIKYVTYTRNCTEVTRGDKKILLRVGQEPQFKKREPKQIILHITAGWGYPGKAQGTTEGLATCLHKWDTMGIHYTVDWQGDYAKGVQENIRSIHADNWNNYGIGFENSCFFDFKNIGGGTYQAASGIYYSNVTFDSSGRMLTGEWSGKKWGGVTPKLVKLPYKFYGSDVFQDLTDPQVQTIVALCKDIMNRYPKIGQAIRSQKIWKCWGWDNEPAPGSSVLPNKYTYEQQQELYGIFGHNATNGKNSHADPPPTPGFVKVLTNLGCLR